MDTLITLTYLLVLILAVDDSVLFLFACISFLFVYFHVNKVMGKAIAAVVIQLSE